MVLAGFAIFPTAVLCLTMVFGDHAQALQKSSKHARPPSTMQPVDRVNFHRSTVIDNKWSPMKPGTRWIYEGTTVADSGKVVPRRIEITATDLRKVISGVATVVSYDLDFTNGALAAAGLSFNAQDNNGNVWRFGEYPEEYDHGRMAAARAWIDGIEGARAGIIMRARPRLFIPRYARKWAPEVNWRKRGEPDQRGRKSSFALGSYEYVLVLAEFHEDEKDAFQLKFYAPGTGYILMGWVGKGEKTKETLQLVKIERLTPDALAGIRAKALKLEHSAYTNSKDVYGRTPAVYRSGIGTK